MQSTFQQRLNEQLILSERRRTVILIGIFVFGLGFRIIDLLFLQPYTDAKHITSFTALWLFPVAIIAFEVFSFLYIDKRIRSNRKQLPLIMQYVNTALEICLPTVVMVLVAVQYPTYDIIASPAFFIYFIFIVLSTLRLNFWLSAFCGLLASISCAVLSQVIRGHFDAADAGRAVIILLTGIAAGLVATRIKAGINNSLKEAEKRQKAENLFGQQISAEVAEKLLENDGMLESKRIHVAVMFIDIRNFSSFAAGKSPEDIVQYQNAFFTIVINTVSRFHGVVHQFLGDGCMVTFGAPLYLKNSPQHAVDAATALLKMLELAAANGELIPTRIGIGIHAGEVVTGNIGTTTRQQYSITGSTVILASRIEQLNKQFGSQLLVSGDVICCIDLQRFHATSFGTVPLKGWHNPIPIYELSYTNQLN